MSTIHRHKSIVSQSCADRALERRMPEKIDGTDFELCEFSDQCESCVHYGPVYFGYKDYFDSREGHYHCKSCVEGMRDDPGQFVDDEDDLMHVTDGPEPDSCDACGGAGEIRIDWFRDGEKARVKPCKKCGGRGFVAEEE